MSETEQAIMNECDEAVKPRRKMELAIARETIRALKGGGFDLIADNGEDESHGNEEQILRCLFACDEARLIASKTTSSTVTSGWVFFVWGNSGWDSINDYTTNLEHWLAPVNELADKLEEGAR